MINTSAYSSSSQLLALTRFGGMTPRLFERLFQHYGGLSQILEATATSHRKINGISTVMAGRLSKAAEHLPEAQTMIESMRQRDIHVSTRFDEDYLELLNELNDPPNLLFLRGKMPSSKKKIVTLVGAREATAEGIALTTRLAQIFAKADIQIVSSLNVGNDAAAHLGAKAAGGSSYAVIDTGFDNLDEAEHVALAIDIAQSGGVLSEYPPDFKMSDSTLAESNRLLVGLGQAVVVTEVYEQSRRTHDLLEFCGQIGKLSFFVVDTATGPLADAKSLKHALGCGAILLEGVEHTDDIIKSLV